MDATSAKATTDKIRGLHAGLKTAVESGEVSEESIREWKKRDGRYRLSAPMKRDHNNVRVNGMVRRGKLGASRTHDGNTAPKDACYR
jgi:hypothetical protein